MPEVLRRDGGVTTQDVLVFNPGRPKEPARDFGFGRNKWVGATSAKPAAMPLIQAKGHPEIRPRP